MLLENNSKKVFAAAFLTAVVGGGLVSLPVEAAGLKAGQRMHDKTVYVGISPDTQRPLYAAPADLNGEKSEFINPAYHTWFVASAEEACKNYKLNGKGGFRLPSKAELNLLYQNQNKGALKGTFNDGVKRPDYYVSSTPVSGHPEWRWVQYFAGDKEYRGTFDKAGSENDVPVRCVR